MNGEPGNYRLFIAELATEQKKNTATQVTSELFWAADVTGNASLVTYPMGCWRSPKESINVSFLRSSATEVGHSKRGKLHFDAVP